jgi:hypothetical protein
MFNTQVRSAHFRRFQLILGIGTFLELGVWILVFSSIGVSGSATAAEAQLFPMQLKNGVVQLAELPKDDFRECSGLVVSRQFPGVLWTHNDGTDRRLFAINRQGEKLAEFELNRVFLFDLEDIALDEANRLYLADIGNNLEVRPRVVVYRVPEPDPENSGAKLVPEAFWYLEFPEESFDAESILVWQDFGYVISKTSRGKKARLYRWPLGRVGESIRLEELGKLDVKSPVTGADLSWDGGKLGLVTTDGACVFDLRETLESAMDRVPFELECKVGQIEGCAFDRDGLLAIAESRELFLFNAEPFVPAPSK